MCCLSSCYFQKTLDFILQGISLVICYIDDILVTEADDDEHLQNLAEVIRIKKKMLLHGDFNCSPEATN